MPVKKASYVDLKVSSRSGQGAAVLGALSAAGVDLLAFTGFPDKGKAQIDLIAQDLSGVRKVARKEGWRIGKAKRCFVIQGRNAVGSVHRHLKKLADARINVTAVDAVAAGKGQFGMILWVKPKDFAKAARKLGAR